MLSNSQSTTPFAILRKTTPLAFSTTSVAIDLGLATPQYQIINDCDSEIFVQFGNDSTVTATAGTIGVRESASYPVQPGCTVSVTPFSNYEIEVIELECWVAMICPSGTGGTVWVTPGAGS